MKARLNVIEIILGEFVIYVQNMFVCQSTSWNLRNNSSMCIYILATKLQIQEPILQCYCKAMLSIVSHTKFYQNAT